MNDNLDINSLEGEIWKSIPEWEGYYSASNFGRIKSNQRTVAGGRWLNQMVKEKIKKQWLLNDYPAVTLNNGKYKTNICCHVLVARTFLPNPENKPHVNHIDGNKHNPMLSNLEWCTPKENVQHAIRIGKVKLGEEKWDTKFTNEQVIHILNSEETSGEISKKYKVSKSIVKAIRKGKTYKSVTGLTPIINPYKDHQFNIGAKPPIIDFYKNTSAVIKNEKWSWVYNMIGYYKVSNLGRVKSVDRKRKYKSTGESNWKGRVLKQKLNKYGYLAVCLMAEGVRRYTTVHVLVAETFLNKNNGDYINHVNGIKTDNRIDNLELCDNNYNVAHSIFIKKKYA